MAAAILKNTLPVEPPLWERNSWFITSNQKSIFCGVILKLKGSLLLRALMLIKRFPLQIGKSKNGSKCWCFLGRRPLKSEFEGSKSRKSSCTKQNNWFELSNVRIGLELRPGGEIKKQKNIKKGRTKVTKPWYFTTLWQRPLCTNLNQIQRVCRCHQRYYLCQKWLKNFHWFFQADRWKNAYFPI